MTTVRVDEKTHEAIKEIAELDGDTVTGVVARAVEAYRRQRMLESLDIAFAALKADPAAWAEELAARAEWDVTLKDGLEDE